MNKQQKLFFILGIISFLTGGALIFICSFNEKFDIQLTKTTELIIGIFGILFIIGSIACMLLYLNNVANHDENFKIEQNDERNIMIRGKAAETSMLITTFVMLIVELILICMGDTTSALLIAIAMFLCAYSQMLLFVYYQKKY